MIYFLLTKIAITIVLYAPDRIEKNYILDRINTLRAEGCYCGNDYMPSTGPLTWNETLQLSAFSHAKDMFDNDFFSHISPDGKDVGQRVKSFGYNWRVVGENIGEGQFTFDEVFDDWVKSTSHCKMMMDSRVREMGVAKYKRFWVQHFASPMPFQGEHQKE